jgi:putative oxidoreductase
VKVAWSRVWNLIVWILRGFLAILFLYAGTSKLNPSASLWSELFHKIGFGQWFRYFVGSLEVVCAILLLIPGSSAIAAVLLSFTMVGAVAVHLLILHDGYATFFPGFTLLLLAVVALRWRSSPAG